MKDEIVLGERMARRLGAVLVALLLLAVIAIAGCSSAASSAGSTIQSSAVGTWYAHDVTLTADPSGGTLLFYTALSAEQDKVEFVSNDRRGPMVATSFEAKIVSVTYLVNNKKVRNPDPKDYNQVVGDTFNIRLQTPHLLSISGSKYGSYDLCGPVASGSPESELQGLPYADLETCGMA